MAANIRRPTGKDIPAYIEFNNRNIEREIDRSRKLDIFNVADAPDPATNIGLMIFVPDESGGPALALSDGAAWFRVTLGPAIS